MDPTAAKSVEDYERRYLRVSDELEKRSRGAAGVSFRPISDRHCIANASIWGLSDDEYRAGKNVLATSPKSGTGVLGNIHARDHEKMVGFIQNFDLESDPNYEGMIPGTVSLKGYVSECNRLKKIFAAERPVASNENVRNCATCLNLCLDGKYVPKMLKSSLNNIEASFQRGCLSCGLLRNGINLMKHWFPTPDQAVTKPPAHIDGYTMLQREGYMVGRERLEFGSNESVINSAYGRGCGLCITYVYRNGAKDILGTAVDLDFFQAQDDFSACPWQSIRKASQISGDTSSNESFTRALSWLETCRTGHTCSTTHIKYLPYRVLDLGTDDWESRSSVKLIETNHEPADYVCLSYCWGKIRNLTTTTKNLDSHRSCIPWSSLPLTFQDAVTFTRRLKIRYLWIDSLCIIQDDYTDWDKQASSMPSIYENSYVTLAATASDSSAGGCFQKADARYTAKETMALDNDGKTHKIYVRQHLPHWLKADSRYPELSHEDFPILDRAWILQERFLSPRVIHFCRHELVWECKELAACECSFLDAVEREHLDKPRFHRMMFQGNDEKPERQAQQQAHRQYSPAQRWRALASRYSKLKLTKDDDIFPALSGLAKQINREINDTYLAGLWKKNLPLDLLWQSNKPSLEKPSRWRAPSWSWARHKSSIDWVSDLNQECQPEIHLKILETRRILVGENETGAISSASLRAHGRMCPAKLVVYPSKSDLGQMSADLSVGNVWVNDLPEPGARLFFLKMEIKLDSALSPTTACLDRHDTSLPKHGYRVFCLRIATLSSHEYSLIVRPLDEATHQYERIGIVAEYVGYSGDREQSLLPWNSLGKCPMQIITLT